MVPTSSYTTQRRGAVASSASTVTSNGAPRAAAAAINVQSSVTLAPPRARKKGQLAWGETLSLVIRILVLLVALFCLVDLYYLMDLVEHNKLKDVKPIRRVQEQLEQMMRRKMRGSGHEPGRLGGDLGVTDRKGHAQWQETLIQQARKNEADAKERERQMQEEGKKYESMSWEEVDADKDEIFEILEAAGIPKTSLSKAIRGQLPTWSHVLKEYGDRPIIHGLECCEAFTKDRNMSISFFGIAGTFNSGTNLLAELLIQNCQITERMELFGEDQRGIRWQVPWGKHSPVQFRGKHVTRTDREVVLENSFPMITIRDPYSWLLSMCRHSYEARWVHDMYHCPNVVDYETGEVSQVYIPFKEATVSYESLTDMYNKWYLEYFEAKFPRVFVRFEDLLFFGKEITQTLCKCGGGKPRQAEFKHIEESAKLGTVAHGNHKTGLVQALIWYGNVKNRTMQMTPADIAYTKKNFDPWLMEMFKYRHPE